MEQLNNKEVQTNNYEDVRKMQETIAKNSTEFEKLGLSKLKGSNRTFKNERERLTKEINKNGVAQCDSCNQTITYLSIVIDNEDTKTSKEAERIKEFAKKGTTCNCCGNEAKVKSIKLDWTMAVSLIEIVKFYRHAEHSDESKYYTKEDFFAGNLEEYSEIFEKFELLHHWDLIARMPTRPDRVVYKDGWFGITENGIKFAQRELGVPKTCHIYNGETDSYDSDFVTIEDLLKEAELNYDDLIKVD